MNKTFKMVDKAYVDPIYGNIDPNLIGIKGDNSLSRPNIIKIDFSGNYNSLIYTVPDGKVFVLDYFTYTSENTSGSTHGRSFYFEKTSGQPKTIHTWIEKSGGVTTNAIYPALAIPSENEIRISFTNLSGTYAGVIKGTLFDTSEFDVSY